MTTRTNSFKRILSVFLSFVMLLSCAPLAVFAEEGSSTHTHSYGTDGVCECGAVCTHKVSTFAELEAALAAGGNIILQQDITKENGSVETAVPKDVKGTLDLNGKTLSLAAGGTRGLLTVYGELTVKDGATGGAIDTTANTYSTAVNCKAGGKVTFESGEMKSSNQSTFIEVAGEVIVNGGTFGGVHSMYVFGDAAKATVNGGTFNGEIHVESAAMTVNGGTFHKDVYAYSGAVEVAGGTFNKQFTVESSTLKVTGGQLYRLKSLSGSTVTIFGGTHSFEPYPWVPAGSCTVTDNGNTTWTVVCGHEMDPATGKCKTCGTLLAVLSYTAGDTVTYYGLDELNSGSVYFYTKGGVIRLLQDINLAEGKSIKITANAQILDLCGFTLKSYATECILAGTSLHLQDSSAAGTGKLVAESDEYTNAAGIYVQTLAGTVKIDDGIEIVADEWDLFLDLIGTLDLSECTDPDYTIYANQALEKPYETILLKKGLVLKKGDDVLADYNVVLEDDLLTVGQCPGHQGGDATCVSGKVCQYCCEEYGEPNENSHELVYTVSEDGATCTASCELCKAVLETVTLLPPKAKVYGDGNSCYVTGLLNGEEIGEIPGATYYRKDGETLTKLDAASSDAGSYRAECIVYGGNEFNPDDDVVVYVEYTIERAECIETAPTAKLNLVYNGKPQELVTAGTAKDGFEIRYWFPEGEYQSSVLTATDAGTYTVKWYAGQDTDNYKLSLGEIQVTISPMDITGKNAEITLGNTLTYNGAEQTMAVTSAKAEGFDLTYTVSGNRATDAGTHTMTLTGTGNFTGTLTKDWSIGKKALTVKAKDQTVATGDVPDQSQILCEGLVSGHSVTAVLTAPTGEVTDSGTVTVSSATVTADGKDVTENYEIRYESGKLKVVLKGDVDGDSVVDTDDAIYLLFHINFKESYPINQSANFDGLGEVDTDDAIYLLFHVNFKEFYPLQ